MNTVAIVGAGAMGAGIAARLVNAGIEVRTFLDGRSDATRARAAQAGMIGVGAADLMEAPLLLSVVPPSEAEGVLGSLLPALSCARVSPVFVDCNALAPDTKRRMAGKVTASGGRFVDATILGLPPVPGEPGPRTLVCGPDADEVLVLDGRGLTVRLLPGPVGTAAAVKMCYAGINKGLTALTTAMLLAAERAGAGEALRSELEHGLPWLVERSRRSVPAMYPKAYRWVGEMDEIARFLAEDSSAAAIFTDIGRFFGDRAATEAGGAELGRLRGLLNVEGTENDA